MSAAQLTRRQVLMSGVVGGILGVAGATSRLEATQAAPAEAPPPAAAAETDATKRSIRSVGPTFIPPR